MMRTLKIIAPDNTHIIDLVDPHFNGCMNDLMRAQKNAHMGDLPLLIVKKSQITRPGFFKKAYRLALGSLLVGVT